MARAVIRPRDDALSPYARTDGGWQQLPDVVRTYWRLTTAMGSSALAAGVVLAFATLPILSTLTLWGTALTGLLVVIAAVEIIVLVPRRHAYYCFAVSGTTVRRRRGRVLRRELQIPIDKVLYVELKDNPITRRLGLVHVHLGTIAEDQEIGPVTPEQGRQIAHRVQSSTRDETGTHAT